MHFYLIFDSIYISLFLLMWFAGHKISRGRTYWEYAIWVVFAFSLVEAIRYDRGVDYLHYVNVFNNNLESSQTFFLEFNNILKCLGFSAYTSFGVYAAFFISGAMILFRSMRKYASYLLPLFFISIISMHEAFVRQFFAMSFIFLYVNTLNKLTLSFKRDRKKIIALMLLFTISYLFHSISAITISVITCLYFLGRRPFSWKITIPLLFFGKFIVASSIDLTYFNSIFSFLSSADDKFAMYINSSDVWFSNDAIKAKYTRNFVIQIFEFLGCCSLFYLGSKICSRVNATYRLALDNGKQEEKKTTSIYVVLFNTTVVGYLVLETFFNLEIVRRVAFGWSIYWFIPVSLILYYRSSPIFTKNDRIIMFGLLFWLWDILQYLFAWPKEPLFLWHL